MAALTELCVATANPGKAAEIRAALEGLPLRLLTPAELGATMEGVAETGETLLANARIKARACALATGKLAVADDSGLEVDALDGEPGVRSARWSGGGPEANNRLLLERLEALGDVPRTAVFRTVLAVAEPGGREDWVAGSCEGSILREPRGSRGFAYDPLFFVPTLGKTFAEMDVDEKNSVSHRGEALRRLRTLLLRW